jgi:hypothetical protein
MEASAASPGEIPRLLVNHPFASWMPALMDAILMCVPTCHLVELTHMSSFFARTTAVPTATAMGDAGKVHVKAEPHAAANPMSMRPAPMGMPNPPQASGGMGEKERRDREDNKEQRDNDYKKVQQEEQLIVALWLNINKFM